jgi:hypothetical protein
VTSDDAKRLLDFVNRGERYSGWLGRRYPPPRPVGRCMIPPRGLTFWQYHGPLVPCPYDTARYDTAGSIK